MNWISLWLYGKERANKALNRNWQAARFLWLFGPVKWLSRSHLRAGLANPVSLGVRARKFSSFWGDEGEVMLMIV